MTEEKKLRGVVPIVPTPFDENEEIDEGALRGLIDFAAESSLKGVCLPAYASEFYKLSDEEKIQVVKIAADQAKGRLQIVAQSNHASVKHAIRIAEQNIKSGADVISIAIPRMFSVGTASVYEYLSIFLKELAPVPVLVQDFNPGGGTVNAEFIKDITAEFPNLKYLKLEEPLAATKFEQIIQTTEGRLGVFEGWGGLYMMELIPVGITGAMPGFAVADILQKAFDYRKQGDIDKAFYLFEKVMPQIFFSLQSMELFHYAEKELLVARNLLSNSISRSMRYIPDAHTVAYIKLLNERMIQFLEQNNDILK